MADQPVNYDRYLELGQLISGFEAERKLIATAILKRMQEEKTERVATSAGIISLKTRTSWKYPPATKAQVEAVQRIAQESGEAEKVETTYLSTSIR